MPVSFVVKNGSKMRARDVLAHAAAAVLHGERHVAARRERQVARRRGELDVGGLDGERAAVGHRVARVHREVHEHLRELVGVGEHRPDAVLQLRA